MDITRLFEKHKTDVYRFALSFVKDLHTAQDITQEVFLRLMQSQSQIHDLSKIKTWLLTTTRNLSLNTLKNRSRETEIPDDLPADSATNLDFFAMLDCLNETDRQIVTLHIVTGLKHRETAKIMDLSSGTVRQRYSRALKIIKENL
jgi:RNA polymerase sigma-70 factor (ECF subfamily)